MAIMHIKMILLELMAIRPRRALFRLDIEAAIDVNIFGRMPVAAFT